MNTVFINKLYVNSTTMKKVNKQCLLDTPRTVWVSEKDEYNTKLFTPESSIYQSLYRKNSLSSHRCHFIKNYFFPNQTLSCICSMCLHFIGKVSNCSIKSCGWSWSAHEGTIYAYTKALLGKVSNYSIKSCSRSWSAHEGTIYAYTKA